ncbi:hypothetical protein E4A48_02930 [Xanthomonas cerealis pv. cerealis]|uniref:Uncharacterized protein n=1 Tax=Xanthomonas cerealis pv. cerealis TaxID=152263 RepID=A0A514E9T1_9XANT|nr:hypothetical protein [Xanthomonas translucens]QDI02791.1 hypothetical protein E4A48_02930 [Xanthomonas translucens pv. cerealis]
MGEGLYSLDGGLRDYSPLIRQPVCGDDDGQCFGHGLQAAFRHRPSRTPHPCKSGFSRDHIAWIPSTLDQAQLLACVAHQILSR